MVASSSPGIDSHRRSGDTDRSDLGRVLVIANQTLVNPALRVLVAERYAARRTEFHVLVPQALVRASRPTDPLGTSTPTSITGDDPRARHEAQRRLDEFRRHLTALGPDLTGEVVTGSPVWATRRAFECVRYDEIVLSTLPVAVSRWLRVDLPSRLEREFDVPITILLQEARFALPT
ncbi:MAG: hypothetical protein ACFCVK_09010 [Acidimicrobiales bacterium]